MAIETTRTDLVGGTTAVPVGVPVPVRHYPTTMASIGLLALRVPIGLYFVFAGVAKFRGGVGGFVESQLATATKYMPENFARMYLNTLPYAEIALGVMLIIGLLTRFAGLVITALLVSFTIAATGLKHPQLPFHPNAVYLGIGLAILFCGPGRLSVDNFLFARRRKVTITEQYTERLP